MVCNNGCHIADLNNVDAFHNSRNHKTVIADKHRLLQLTEQAVPDNTQQLSPLENSEYTKL